MWLLRNISDGTTRYLLSQNSSYVVGRRNGDIILKDDASISRKHCTFCVAKADESSFTKNALTRVWILDESSKYGTFLKNNDTWEQLNAQERKILPSGSIIRFGILENIWSLEYKPFIVCVSGFPDEEKKKIESLLQSIDGCLRNSWCRECTLVIAKDITLTQKVLLALINGIPLVTLAYAEMVVECVNKQTKLPNYKNYQPHFKESILDKFSISLDTDDHRRDLFKGKKFIVPTKRQLEIFEKIIVCAGGTIELFSDGQSWENFGDDNVVVIQVPLNNSATTEQLVKSYKEIALFLKTSYGKRIVPDSEIAQAVVYSSIEKFCNPKSSCFNLKIEERKQINLGPVIVEDTSTSVEEVKLTQPGVVCASATYDSETPLHGNAEAPSPTNKHAPARELSLEGQHSGSIAERQTRYPLPQRKRSHNSDTHGHETPSKRARNPDTSSGEGPGAVKEPSVKDKGWRDKVCESIGNPSGTAEAESPCGTNNFQTRNALPEGNIRVTRQSNSDFWDCATTQKRKISTESHDSGENSKRKKAKLLERLNSKERTPEIHAPKDGDEIALPTVSFITDALSLSSGRKVQEVEGEDDFTDYFGKETSDADINLCDLNNTLLSLAIISPCFLKEDGSLADPPDVPVNVKRFKKQKILSAPSLNPLEDEELSDGEWLEPHSNRLNISVPEY